MRVHLTGLFSPLYLTRQVPVLVVTSVWLPSRSYSKSCGVLAMWTRLVTDATSSGPLVGEASAAVVRRTGARRHLLLARSAAETANGAMGLVRMVLLGLTGAYYTISAAMRLRCGRNAIPQRKVPGKVPRPSPSLTSSALLSFHCADAQGWKSALLDKARKFHLKFSVADPYLTLLSLFCPFSTATLKLIYNRKLPA